MTVLTMTTSISEVLGVLVLLALAHTVLVGAAGPADRAFAEDPALTAARLVGAPGLR